MSPTIDETEQRAWIRLSLEPELGAARIRLLLSVFGLPQNICQATTSQLAKYLDGTLAARLRQAPDAATQEAIDHTLHWLDQPRHHLLTLADPAYPQALFQLNDPPPVLFAHGQLDTLNRPMLGIVGARSATPEGSRNARDFAQYLAAQGWCVVSGLASGIDGAAHAGALDAGPAGGGTIAILGTGIDRVYPSVHRALAHRLVEHGLMLSEFPLGTQGLPYHFPQRNRIVAALSQGILVVEAAARSGSLITARLAGELGREVFAIPGSIHSPLSRGCHALIRQGAKLVESAQDIVEELQQSQLPMAHPIAAMRPRPTHLRPDASPTTVTDSCPTDPVAAKLLQALGYEPTDADTLQARTGWPVQQLMTQLTLLELNGQLERQADGRYQRLP
ncbi:DNA-processing protein DprA [Castellaniella sp.]|uniref:DNA-processing protein DprA n=1 Tax=Castellaniella sp. TaxID=1955812 RepID=UPI002AFE10A4|nr:DNA-processing protein DprA [Castellaniella sp.]